MDICKHDEFCGGCSYQNLQYQEQLRIKEEQVLEFAKASGIKPKKFEHIEPGAGLDQGDMLIVGEFQLFREFFRFGKLMMICEGVVEIDVGAGFPAAQDFAPFDHERI